MLYGLCSSLKTGNNPNVGQLLNGCTNCGTSINRILLLNKINQTTDSRNNKDESQKHYVKWMKPETKDYTFHLYDILEKVKLQGQKSVQGIG